MRHAAIMDDPIKAALVIGAVLIGLPWWHYRDRYYRQAITVRFCVAVALLLLAYAAFR